MKIWKPYTYLIGWVEYDKWYYGVRYAQDSYLGDIWIDYFTSSKYVSDFRNLYGEPDVIQVRKIFNSVEEALDYEHRILRKLGVMKTSKWLNESNGGKGFGACNLGRKHSIETRQMWSKQRLGNTNAKGSIRTENFKENLKKKNKGSNNPFFGKKHSKDSIELFKRINAGTGNPMYGRKNPSQQIIKQCPHCGKHGAGGAMHTWHFDKCKKKP